jgi:hypothetical protein
MIQNNLYRGMEKNTGIIENHHYTTVKYIDMIQALNC